jgi:spermidine synthase
VTRGRTLALALFSVGLTAIVGQVLLMRELLATLYGNELLFGLILAAWLGWGAIGAGLALTGRRAAWRMPALAAGLAAAALLLPAQLALTRGLRTLLGATPGSMLDLGPLILAVILVLAPLCLCLGALFSLGTRSLVDGGGTPGQAYVWDSAGGAAGGVLFSFVFVRWLNPFQTAFLVGGFALAVAVLVLARPADPEPSGRLRKATNGIEPPGEGLGVDERPAKASGSRGVVPTMGTATALATLAVFTMLAFPLGRAAQSATLRLEWPDASSGTAQSLLFSGDSPYGRLAVQARGSQRIFYTDGLLAFETQATFPEEVAHLALLAHPAPKDVLLIGGGIAGDLREILKHPVDSVTYVELDPLLIEAARDYLPAAEAAILDDPRVHLVLTDGRAFVASRPGSDGTQRAGSGSYDAIIMDLPEPTTGALNRFYTAEFFAQARKLLHPGGVLSFGLPSAENYWNPELAQRNASLYRTLGAVFPSVTVLPGEQDFFLAGEVPVELDAGVMSARLAQRGIQTRWVTPAYLQDLLTGDRFAQAQERVTEETGVRINRDLSPLSYTYSLAHWLARFYPGLRQAFEGAGLLRAWWLAIPLVLLLLLARWRRRWRVSLVVAGVGMAQMLLELVLLFAFQALHGSLYVEVGLIVTAFMGGLALGGAAGNRILRIGDCELQIADCESGRRPVDPIPDSDNPGQRSKRGDPSFLRRALVGVLAGTAVYSAALPVLFSTSLRPQGVPQLAFPVLALIGGLLGGMVFPLASGLKIEDRQSGIANPQSAIGGILYAADLAGGCLGALLGAALFIPILGIPQTCAAIALLAVAALLAIL